jgi:hypothetical protein
MQPAREIAQPLSSGRSKEFLVRAALPVVDRYLRIDLLGGIGNWAIFVAHIPNNVISWIAFGREQPVKTNEN